MVVFFIFSKNICGYNDVEDAMKDLKYEFIGWYKQNPSDKIWGVIELISPKTIARIPTYGKYLVFWGRRGTKYQTKFVTSLSPTDYYHSIIATKIQEKLDKGYKKVDKSSLDSIYPNFEKDLSDLAFWTMMTKTDKLSLEEWEEIKKEIF